MKKYLFSLLALLLALCTVSFAGIERTHQGGYYWFALNSLTGSQIPHGGQAPTLSLVDPYNCLDIAIQYCSRAYTEYEIVPGTWPVMYRGKAGTDVMTHYKH